MTTQELVEAFERKAFERGHEHGLEQGAIALRGAILDLYESRLGPVPQPIRQTVEAMHDPSTLRGWIKLVGVASAEEIARGIRSGEGH